MAQNVHFSVMSQKIREHYDRMANEEWKRLVRDPYHRLEFIVTLHFLKKYLPKSGLILDAGGGPGRYTIELAKKGYDIVLMDISPKCLELARKKMRRARIESNVKKIVEGSVTDLSIFSDAQFDSILCLGPFSHLIDGSDREKAVNEILRVAKNGAPLFISVIGLYGVFRTVLQRLPHELTDPTHEEMFFYGIHHGHEIRHKKEHGFPDAYFLHVNKLRQLFEGRGVKTLEIAACEGLSSHLQGPTNKLHRNKEAWTKWVNLILKTCSDPTIVGIGEHLLYVGRKK